MGQLGRHSKIHHVTGLLPYFFLFVGTILAFLPSACTSVRPLNFATTSEEVAARLKADVEFLASDSLGGRPPGTRYERIAADYIRARWREAGLKSTELAFEVTQDSGMVNSLNLAAYLDSRADSTIVIAAHFDHLGQGGEKSLEIRKSGLHPGADDNASGVAMMLELARHLSTSQNRRYNYLFLGLSCHEIGLYGSKAFSESKLAKSLKMKLFLNLDMVGRLNRNSKTIRFSFCHQFPSLEALAYLPLDKGLKIRPDLENETVNDYSVLCEAGFPSISITSGIHEDYHRMSDRPSEINYPGMMVILEYCTRIVTL